MSKRKASTPASESEDDLVQHEVQTTVIVSNGDLYVVCNESKKMLVSRYILCLASKVFQAMLGDNSHFREATNPTLSCDGIREVVFDDDFATMLTIMRILHLQHDDVPSHISFTQLTETALICDKYDLVRSIGPWPKVWAQYYLDRIEKKGFHDWLLVSSVFRLEEAYTKTTKFIILNSKVDTNAGELVTYDGWPFTEGVPSTVVGMKNDVTYYDCYANRT